MPRTTKSRIKKTARAPKKDSGRFPSTTPPLRPAIGSLDVPDLPWYLSHVESEALAACKKHGTAPEAALKEYDRARLDLEGDPKAMRMLTLELESWPVRLLSRSIRSERKQHEIRIAAALLRSVDKTRELLRNHPQDGPQLFKFGAIIRGLHVALRFSDLESDRATRAQAEKKRKKDREWAHVENWCRHQAFVRWRLYFDDVSVEDLAKTLVDHVASRLKEFGIDKAPTQKQMDGWIRPMRLIGPKRRGRPSKVTRTLRAIPPS